MTQSAASPIVDWQSSNIKLTDKDNKILFEVNTDAVLKEEMYLYAYNDFGTQLFTSKVYVEVTANDNSSPYYE